MNSEIQKILYKYSEDERLVNQLIVTAFVISNNLIVEHNSLIKELVLSKNSKHYLTVSNYLTSFDFDDSHDFRNLVL